MPTRTWTDAQLVDAVATSRSFRAVAASLGISPVGDNHTTIRRHIKRLGLDTSHFMTMSEYLKGSGKIQQIPLEELRARFTVDSDIRASRHLHRFQDPTHCAVCGQENRWFGKPLKLQVDHINGDRRDNRLENLRFICPNCHTQTHTFAGKRFRKNPVKPGRGRPNPNKARVQTPKIAWPDRDTLQHMVTTIPTSVLAQQLGVSDQAISKRCARLGITKPGRGHWAKHRPHGETLEDTPASETGAK